MTGKSAVVGQNAALLKGLPLASVCKVFFHAVHSVSVVHPRPTEVIMFSDKQHSGEPSSPDHLHMWKALEK